MTAKYPVSSDYEGVRKRLNPKTREKFIIRWHKHADRLWQNNEAYRVVNLRLLFINQTFLNYLFQHSRHDSPFFLHFTSTDFRIYHLSYNYYILFNIENYQTIISIIRLSTSKGLILSLGIDRHITSDYVSFFIRLCNTIKGL